MRDAVTGIRRGYLAGQRVGLWFLRLECYGVDAFR